MKLFSVFVRTLKIFVRRLAPGLAVRLHLAKNKLRKQRDLAHEEARALEEAKALEEATAIEQTIADLPPKERLRAQLTVDLGKFIAQAKCLTFLPCERPIVSVVVVVWNQAAMTLRCLTALHRDRAAGFELEVILVDNASSDRTRQLLTLFPGLVVLSNDSNKGFLLACNQGAQVARGKHLLLLNNDAAPREGAIQAALDRLEQDPTVGAVGGRVVLPDGNLQEAGSIVWADGFTNGYARGRSIDAPEANVRRDMDYCSAAFLMTPSALWRQLGGFDEAYRPAYFEDADYCLRVWDAGYRVVFEPTATIDHFEFASQSHSSEAQELMLRHLEIFKNRHKENLKRHVKPGGPAAEIVACYHWRTRRPQLLVIDDEAPLDQLGAGFPRMRRLLHAAASAGWQVTFFSIDWPLPPADVLRRAMSWDIECVGTSGPESLEPFLAARAGAIDCLLVSRPANMRAVRPFLGMLGNARIVYDAEALFSARAALKAQVMGNPLDPAEIENLTNREVELADGVDCMIAVTDKEAGIFRQRLALPIHVLSHPVRPPQQSRFAPERSGFLFVGRVREKDSPNWFGLEGFINRAWPEIRRQLPTAQLTVAGLLADDHKELAAPGVELLGPIDDLAPLYDRSRVFLAPIHFAAGIPIKVLEASAAGLPTLATALMAQQLDWRDGEEIVVAKTTDAWVDMAVRLHEDESFWAKVATGAQSRALAEHGEELFNRRVREILPPAYARRDGGPNPPADGV